MTREKPGALQEQTTNKRRTREPAVYIFNFSIDEGDGYRWLHDIRARRKAKQTRRATKPK